MGLRNYFVSIVAQDGCTEEDILDGLQREIWTGRIQTSGIATSDELNRFVTNKVDDTMNLIVDGLLTRETHPITGELEFVPTAGYRQAERKERGFSLS